MKNEFIQNLQNRSLPAQISQTLLEKLRQENATLFVAIEEESGIATPMKEENHLWSVSYYNELISSLEKLPVFSYKRASHIVEVKGYLQKQGVKDFSIQQIIQKSSADNHVSINNAPKDKKIMEFDIEKLLKDFQLNEIYQEALNKKETAKLRSMVLSDLNNVRIDFGTILKTGLYLEKRDNTLFEEYAISPFYPEIATEQSQWNANYFSEQQGYLNKNFARERFLHLINVSEYLGKQGVKGFVREEKKATPERVSSQQQTQKVSNQYASKPYSQEKPVFESETNSDNNLLKKALIIGGAVLGIIAALILFK